VEYRIPPGDNLPRHICPACGVIHYENPRVLVTCLATWGQRALWMKRAEEPRKGFWSVPGGFTEKGESLQQAAARELYEETRVRLDPHELVLFGVGTIVHVNQVYVSFRAKLKNPQFELTPEAEDVALFSAEELPWGELAYPELTEVVKMFYREMDSGEYGIYMGEYQPENTYLARMDRVASEVDS
jgi:ADP-ribose pyrophosphatase YjhB (NUDIX family)